MTDCRPVVFDLFCGAGGMSLGFEMAGYHIGLGIDNDPLACQTYAHNFGGRCAQTDIATVSDPKRFIQTRGLVHVDVIIGGPPCQGLSRAGRGRIRSLHNDFTHIHDPRNQYYKDFIRFIEALRPLYFAMENIPDMQYYSDGDGLLVDKALRRLEELGYNVGWNILQADRYGIPQDRRRLFIIGNRLGQKIHWPEKNHEGSPVTVWQAISDLPIVPHGHRRDEIPYEPRCELNEYQVLMRHGAGDTLYNHQTHRHNEQDLEAFAWLPEGGKYCQLPPKHKRYRDDIFKDKYWKLYRDRPSWTVEAHIGNDSHRYIYPSRIGEPEPPRTISVREAARLQSFPDRFRFLGAFTRQFRQAGNAVPPLLAKAVAEAILPGVSAGMTQQKTQR